MRLIHKDGALLLKIHPFTEVTPQQWDAVFAVNTRAPYFLCQAARPHLIQSHLDRPLLTLSRIVLNIYIVIVLLLAIIGWGVIFSLFPARAAE